MRFMFMMIAAFLLVCVAFAHQENENSMKIQDYPDEPDRSALSDGQLVRQVRAAHRMNYPQASYSRAKRLVQQNTPAPTPPPAGNFDEIDLSGFPIGSVN